MQFSLCTLSDLSNFIKIFYFFIKSFLKNPWEKSFSFFDDSVCENKGEKGSTDLTQIKQKVSPKYFLKQRYFTLEVNSILAHFCPFTKVRLEKSIEWAVKLDNAVVQQPANVQRHHIRPLSGRWPWCIHSDTVYCWQSAPPPPFLPFRSQTASAQPPWQQFPDTKMRRAFVCACLWGDGCVDVRVSNHRLINNLSQFSGIKHVGTEMISKDTDRKRLIITAPIDYVLCLREIFSLCN